MEFLLLLKDILMPILGKVVAEFEKKEEEVRVYTRTFSRKRVSFWAIVATCTLSACLGYYQNQRAAMDKKSAVDQERAQHELTRQELAATRSVVLEVRESVVAMARQQKLASVATLSADALPIDSERKPVFKGLRDDN